jgi:hypothetical protein
MKCFFLATLRFSLTSIIICHYSLPFCCIQLYTYPTNFIPISLLINSYYYFYHLIMIILVIFISYCSPWFLVLFFIHLIYIKLLLVGSLCIHFLRIILLFYFFSWMYSLRLTLIRFIYFHLVLQYSFINSCISDY